MPPVITFSIPPSEALRLGLPYFDMFIAGWGGSLDVYGDNSGIIYPFNSGDVKLPSPRGIAIHPQSDVDRVIVETSIGTGVDTTVAKTSALNRLAFSVSVESPLVLAPPTMPVPANGTTPQPTLVLRAHPDALYHTQYAKSGTSTLAAFTGAIIPLSDPERPAFMTPRLILRFYLQTPPPAGVERTRLFLPTTGSFSTAPAGPVPVNSAGPSGEQLFAILPVHGRCCMMLGFRAIDCQPALRIAANDFGFSAPLASYTALDQRMQMERTLYTAGPLSDDVPVQVPVAPGGDWLMLYYTASDGDDGLLMWNLRQMCGGCTGVNSLPGPPT